MGDVSYFGNLVPKRLSEMSYEELENSSNVGQKAYEEFSVLVKSTNWKDYSVVMNTILNYFRPVIFFMASEQEFMEYAGEKAVVNSVYNIIMNEPLRTSHNINLTDDDIFNINRFIYTYTVINDGNPDEITYVQNAEMYYKISDLYNIDTKRSLISVDYDISDEFINKLTVASNSSANEELNIRRAVFVMICLLNDNACEQAVIDILYAIFYCDFSILFNAMMFDPEFFRMDLLGSKRQWNYSMISNALIEMLNERPMAQIREVLANYSEECKKREPKIEELRCSLLNLPKDREWDKVEYIVNEINSEGGYIL